jgi:hypothetical protein
MPYKYKIEAETEKEDARRKIQTRNLMSSTKIRRNKWRSTLDIPFTSQKKTRNNIKY